MLSHANSDNQNKGPCGILCLQSSKLILLF